MEEVSNIYSLQLGWQEVIMVSFIALLLTLLGVLLSLYHRVLNIRNTTYGGPDLRIKRHIEQLSSEQLDTLLQYKKIQNSEAESIIGIEKSRYVHRCALRLLTSLCPRNYGNWHRLGECRHRHHHYTDPYPGTVRSRVDGRQNPAYLIPLSTAPE